MRTIIENEMRTKLVSRKLYKGYEVEGYGDIHLAKVPYGIREGDMFNIYRGESTKNGCVWKGNLQHSLLFFLYTLID